MTYLRMLEPSTGLVSTGLLVYLNVLVQIIINLITYRIGFKLNKIIK